MNSNTGHIKPKGPNPESAMDMRSCSPQDRLNENLYGDLDTGLVLLWTPPSIEVVARGYGFRLHLTS